MTEPQVFHCKRDTLPDGTVYVGRPSRWGNQFSIGRDGTREEVIQKFSDSLTDSDREEIRRDLCGKDLSCWCHPNACHADILLDIANTEPSSITRENT